MILILLAGLIVVGIFHYLLNIQYQPPSSYSDLGGPVTSAPRSITLELSEPDDDSLIFKSSSLVSGKTLPKLNVLVSSQNSDIVIESKTDGSFSTLINLDEGPNTITVTAFNSSGEEKSLTRQIYYSKEKI